MKQLSIMIEIKRLLETSNVLLEGSSTQRIQAHSSTLLKDMDFYHAFDLKITETIQILGKKSTF